MKRISITKTLSLVLFSSLILTALVALFPTGRQARANGEERVFLPMLAGGGPPAPTCSLKFSYQSSADEAFESRVINLINREREKAGAPPVSGSSSLTQVARYHSNDMALNGVLSHDGSQGEDFGTRISWGCDRYSYAGEIIAAGYPNPESVIQGWLNSPPHRSIMLDPVYRVAGVGYAQRNQSEAYWTVDFIAPVR